MPGRERDRRKRKMNCCEVVKVLVLSWYFALADSRSFCSRVAISGSKRVEATAHAHRLLSLSFFLAAVVVAIAGAGACCCLTEGGDLLRLGVGKWGRWPVGGKRREGKLDFTSVSTNIPQDFSQTLTRSSENTHLGNVCPFALRCAVAGLALSGCAKPRTLRELESGV